MKPSAKHEGAPPARASDEKSPEEASADEGAAADEGAEAGAREGSPPAEPPPPLEKLRRSKAISRLSVHGWIAGLAGAFTVLVMGWVAAGRDVMTKGWGLFGAGDPALATAFPLLVIAAVMLTVEIGIRIKVDRGKIIKMPEGLRSGGFGAFVRECIAVYAVEVGLLYLALAVYQLANEYGFAKNAEYYRPWFSVMRYFFWIYVYGGLPYVMLTRALQHDPRADKRQAAFTVMKAGRALLARVSPASYEAPEPFDGNDRTAILGLFVKLFFVPIMTVFFADQFSHLIKNVGYLNDLLFPTPGRTTTFGIRDFYNVSFTVIFSIDVGLAWAGYVISSRWIKNGMYSVEPTVLGWVVALLSYPPFNRVFGFYFSTPGENGFLSISSHTAVTFLALCSVLSFVGYMSATVCFGLRFSNLTHRGIITTGPYAIVRHPAYAAKNFSWWCVMLPYALYDAGTHRSAGPLLQVLGLVMMSSIYYMRAITEERHLGLDPEYQAYAKKVPYRFIPGIV
ncbi:MAG: DUF1295 domain-containing protein [Byssovorax sp.]